MGAGLAPPGGGGLGLLWDKAREPDVSYRLAEINRAGGLSLGDLGRIHPLGGGELLALDLGVGSIGDCCQQVGIK